MSTVVNKPVEIPSYQTSDEKDNFLISTRGFLSWALTLDHKRIGLMYWSVSPRPFC